MRSRGAEGNWRLGTELRATADSRSGHNIAATAAAADCARTCLRVVGGKLRQCSRISLANRS